MSEEFFERLRERANWKVGSGLFHGDEYNVWARGKQFGINAAIEALEGMMVGEPIRARVSHHVTPDGTEWTFVRCMNGDSLSLDGLYGTDGGGVVVGVFRDGQD